MVPDGNKTSRMQETIKEMINDLCMVNTMTYNDFILPRPSLIDNSTTIHYIRYNYNSQHFGLEQPIAFQSIFLLYYYQKKKAI